MSAPPQRSPVFLHVGDLALELLAQARRQRQAPHLLAGALAAASHVATSASSSLITPAMYGPSATMQAPVSVAKSNIASGLSSQRRR